MLSAYLLLHAAKGLKIFCWKFPIEDTDILHDPIWLDWFGDDTCPSLDGPLHQHLPWVLVRFVSYPINRLIFGQIPPTVWWTQWRVSLQQSNFSFESWPFVIKIKNQKEQN